MFDGTIDPIFEKESWRFFDDKNGPANVLLEPGVKITKRQLDALGNNFENTKGGRIDFLLQQGQECTLTNSKALTAPTFVFPDRGVFQIITTQKTDEQLHQFLMSTSFTFKNLGRGPGFSYIRCGLSLKVSAKLLPSS